MKKQRQSFKDNIMGIYDSAKHDSAINARRDDIAALKHFANTLTNQGRSYVDRLNRGSEYLATQDLSENAKHYLNKMLDVTYERVTKASSRKRRAIVLEEAKVRATQEFLESSDSFSEANRVANGILRRTSKIARRNVENLDSVKSNLNRITDLKQEYDSKRAEITAKISELEDQKINSNLTPEQKRYLTSISPSEKASMLKAVREDIDLEVNQYGRDLADLEISYSPKIGNLTQRINSASSKIIRPDIKEAMTVARKIFELKRKYSSDNFEDFDSFATSLEEEKRARAAITSHRAESANVSKRDSSTAFIVGAAALLVAGIAGHTLYTNYNLPPRDQGQRTTVTQNLPNADSSYGSRDSIPFKTLDLVEPAEEISSKPKVTVGEYQTPLDKSIAQIAKESGQEAKYVPLLEKTEDPLVVDPLDRSRVIQLSELASRPGYEGPKSLDELIALERDPPSQPIQKSNSLIDEARQYIDYSVSQGSTTIEGSFNNTVSSLKSVGQDLEGLVKGSNTAKFNDTKSNDVKFGKNFFKNIGRFFRNTGDRLKETGSKLLSGAAYISGGVYGVADLATGDNLPNLNQEYSSKSVEARPLFITTGLNQALEVPEVIINGITANRGDNFTTPATATIYDAIETAKHGAQTIINTPRQGIKMIAPQKVDPFIDNSFNIGLITPTELGSNVLQGEGISNGKDLTSTLNEKGTLGPYLELGGTGLWINYLNDAANESKSSNPKKGGSTVIGPGGNGTGGGTGIGGGGF